VSASTYHKSATRDVRPFFEAATLAEAVDRAQIRLFEDQPFTESSVFVLEEQEVAKLSIAIKPNLAEVALNSGSIQRSKLALAITAANPYLKKTVLVAKIPLASGVPEQVDIGKEVLEQLGGGGNLTIEVVVCLARPAPKQVGKPYMEGHWISKKVFELRPPKPADDFGVDPMDDDGWRAMGLPAKTLYHVDYYGGVNEVIDKDRPIAKVFVHSDVYKKLAADNLPRVTRPMMAFLAAEIPCQLLAASFGDWKDADQVEPKSPLSAFLKRINKVQDCSLQQLKGLVEQPGMPKLRAILHADQGTVRQVAEA
jgi:hypothetical protein